ncbi:hypothetical protein [Xanthomarina sp. GH4-25]|uniref:hypothetical protein n=1 Tax=Xanthomarina sp. GH4-25 TaxID=3349335 RepID=UPI0038783BB1
MNKNKIFSLILILVIFISCDDTTEKTEFQESDKTKMVLQEDILPEEYLKTVEFKNPIYEKRIDSVSLDISYKYESEFWKNNKLIGGFISKCYVHPLSDLNKMDENFLSYIAGQNFEVFKSSNFRYERTYEFELPYKRYRIYKVFANDTLNMGYVFNILKKNKIIYTLIITQDKFEIEIEKLKNKLIEI